MAPTMAHGKIRCIVIAVRFADPSGNVFGLYQEPTLSAS